MKKEISWTEINTEANKILVKKYGEAGIEECELGLPGCTRNTKLGFAHRHKRDWYKAMPELLSEMSETVLACTNCHGKIEYSEKMTKQAFTKLRPRATVKMMNETMTTKVSTPKKALAKKAKKADWMRPHKCIHCGRHLAGLLCQCGQLSMKV